MQNRCKVEVASQRRFGSVLSGKTIKRWHPTWTPFGDHFRPKIEKKRKKKINTVIGHCPGALQERKKNDFWEVRKTSCFLDGFFIEDGSLFDTIFDERTIQKSMLVLIRKSHDF